MNPPDLPSPQSGRARPGVTLAAFTLAFAACSGQESFDGTWDFSQGHESAIVDDDFDSLPANYYDSTVTVILDDGFSGTFSAGRINPTIPTLSETKDMLDGVTFTNPRSTPEEALAAIETWAGEIGLEYDRDALRREVEAMGDPTRDRIGVGSIERDTYVIGLSILDQRSSDKGLSPTLSIFWPGTE